MWSIQEQLFSPQYIFDCSGIGLEIAEFFAKDHYNPVLVAMDEQQDPVVKEKRD